MKTIISKYERLGINIWIEKGKLKFSGPKKFINRDFLHFIDLNNDKIIDYLTNRCNNTKAIASRNQYALWLDYRLGKESNQIYNGMIKKFFKGINVSFIIKAFELIIERHPILKSVFYEQNGVLYTNFVAINDSFIKIIQSDNKKAISDIKDTILETMDLEKGPLIKACICICDNNTAYLAFCIHHIISDAFSLFIIEKEFIEIYNSLIKNEKLENFNKISNVFNYYDREQNYIKSKEYSENILECAKFIDSKIEGTTLPKYLMHSDSELDTIQEFTDYYDHDLSKQINDFTVCKNLTAYTLFLSIINLVLHWYNDNMTNSFGIFALNRIVAEDIERVGYLCNPLVFQHTMNNDQKFYDYLDDIKSHLYKIMNYQSMPFACLVEELKPTRNSGTSFFNIAVDSLLFPENHNIKGMKQDLGILDLEIIKGSSEYDLIIWIGKKDNQYFVDYRYNSIIYNPYQIRSFAETIKGMFSNISHNFILSESNRLFGKSYSLFKLINCTKVINEPSFIIEAILNTCKLFPSNLAIVYENKKLNFGELYNKAYEISNQLTKKGIIHGDYVGVEMEKGILLIPAIIAIWMIGAIYVPIDPSIPKLRKEYIIYHTQLKGIIKNIEGDKIDMILCASFIQRVSINDNKEFNNCNNPAYVIYTSGSTGTPKGVEISHKSLMNFLIDMKNRLELNEDDRILNITSISFDISLLEMFLGMLTGSCTVLMKKNNVVDGKQIYNVIKKNRITIMQATPISYEILCNYISTTNDNEKMLRVCLCGGESFGVNLVKKIFKITNKLLNVYGPTETTIWSTVYEIDSKNIKLKIGKPISNTYVYIADHLYKPQPIGVPGQLMISGAGLFINYHNDKNLTSNSIVRFREKMYYKTGDWCYLDDSGDLVFLGRKDNQIKKHGYRIELSEIENVLKGIDGIINAKVVILKERNNAIGAILIAKNVLTYEEVKFYIKDFLPDYMLPEYVLFVEKFPMTTNLKVDINYLEKLFYDKNESTNKHCIFNDSELELKIIWEDVLKCDISSRNISFFEAGGNSLLLNLLATKIETKYSKKIDIVDLLNFNTLEKMTLYINDNVKHANNYNLDEKNLNRRKSIINRRLEKV